MGIYIIGGVVFKEEEAKQKKNCDFEDFKVCLLSYWVLELN